MSSPESAELDSALQCVDALLRRATAAAAAGETESLAPPEIVQKVLELGTRLYSAEIQSGRKLPAFAQGHGASATDVMITTTAMLKSVNVQLFELGMWQMWATK
jgi:hypothetical protein